MNNSANKILLAVPIYNAPIPNPFLEEALSLGIDILVIDDGSDVMITPPPPVKCIRLTKNRGVGNAMQHAFAYAKSEGYVGVIAADGDGAHPISCIADVWHFARQRPDHFISTNRFGHVGDRYIPRRKVVANAFARELVKHMFHIDNPDVACGLRYYPSACFGMNFRQQGFGFIYEILVKCIQSNIPYHIINVFVEYPFQDMFYTNVRELRDFLEYSLSSDEIRDDVSELLQKLTNVIELLDGQEMHVTLDHTFTFRPIDGNRGVLIGSEEIATPSPHWEPILPSMEHYSIALIPDGNRRWARANGLTNYQGYMSAAKQMISAAKQTADLWSVFGIYWLSLYNLSREPSDLDSIFSAIRYFCDELNEVEHTSIFYGALELLPEDLQKHLMQHNIRSSCGFAGDSKLIVVATAFSSSWECELIDGFIKPHKYGLTPAVLERIWDTRFNSLLRTAGSVAISDFLPRQAAYASIESVPIFFGGIDLTSWIREARSRASSLTYGR